MCSSILSQLRVGVVSKHVKLGNGGGGVGGGGGWVVYYYRVKLDVENSQICVVRY